MKIKLLFLILISFPLMFGCQTTKSVVETIEEDIVASQVVVSELNNKFGLEHREFSELFWQLGFTDNPTMFQRTNTDYLNDREILILKKSFNDWQKFSKEKTNIWKNAFPPMAQTAIQNNENEMFLTLSQLLVDLIIKQKTKAEAVKEYADAVMKMNNNHQLILEKIDNQIRANERRRQLGVANALSEFSKTIGDMNKAPKSTTTNCVTYPGGANCTTW